MTESNPIIPPEQCPDQSDGDIYNAIPMEYRNILWADRRQDDNGDVVVDLGHLHGYSTGTWWPWEDLERGYMPCSPKENWE